jgi:hypothetical protein
MGEGKAIRRFSVSDRLPNWYLNYATRLALQAQAECDAAKVVDFAERRDELDRRRRSKRKATRERPL